MGKGMRHKWSGMVFRGGLLALIWWVLSDGAVESWWVGVPAVLLALICSVALIPPWPFNGYAFLRFAPFFLIRSLRGGVDVAWRAFHPDMPIYPDLIEYPLRLPKGIPRVFMVNTVSLLPGTLSAELSDDCLAVHVLDSRGDYLTEIRAVEETAARIFGLTLKPS